MRTLGNILWFIVAGLWLTLAYALAGLLLCITIIGIPFGVQAFKLAAFTLWPFGKTVVRSSDGGCLEVGMNVVWLIVFGWELFLAHLVAGLVLCITIIGFPFGIQAFKLSVLSLWPFGRSIMSDDSLPPDAVVTHSVPTNPASGES